MSGWVKLYRASSYNKTRLVFIEHYGREYADRAWRIDQDTRFMHGFEDAIYTKNSEAIICAADHLYLKRKEYPKFPIILMEGVLYDSDCKFWILGIRRAIEVFAARKTIVVMQYPHCPLQTLIDDVKEQDVDSHIILMLDSNHLSDVYVSELLHQLELYKRRVSVVIPIKSAQLFGDMCSLRTLNQFDIMILNMGTPDELLPVILSYLTSENKHVLQFSPYMLSFVRSQFLYIHGSIQTVLDIVSRSITMHRKSPSCPNEWAQKARYEFSHLVSCYWKLAERLAPDIQVSVAELHETLQNDSKLDIGFENPIRKRIRIWFAGITARKLVEIAKFLITLCASKDKLAVRLLNMQKTFTKTVKYCRRTSVSEVTTKRMLRKLSQIICERLLRSFILFPYGKQFVVTGEYVERHFADVQLGMETSLPNEGDDCAKCYQALVESGSSNSISIKDWSDAFYIKKGGNNTVSNREAFCRSVYLLEKCDIVSATSRTPKGFANIHFHPLIMRELDSLFP